MPSQSILAQKQQFVADLAEKLKNAAGGVLVDYKGISVEEDTQLRKELRENGVDYFVVKNTLLHKALETLDGDFSELYPALKESTSLMCTNVGNAPAKLLKDFVKKGDTLPLLKGAYVEETVYLGADQLDALAAIKSKHELIADVIALLQSPAKNVVSALQSGGNTLHGLLETLSNKEN